MVVDDLVVLVVVGSVVTAAEVTAAVITTGVDVRAAMIGLD